MPGIFGPILTAGVALGTAAVVVANPINAPRADVRIPALTSTGAAAAMDMPDDEFLRALAPEPAGPTNPVAALKDLVAVLVASAAYLGRNVAGEDPHDADTRPELTAASFPYFGGVPDTWDVAPGGGDAATAGEGAHPSLPVTGPDVGAVRERVDAEVQGVFSQASAVVSDLPDLLPVVGDSALADDRVLSDLVESVTGSVDTELSALRDVSTSAVSTIRSELVTSTLTPPAKVFADVVDALDDAGAKRNSAWRQIRPDGGNDGTRDGGGQAARRLAVRNGD